MSTHGSHGSNIEAAIEVNRRSVPEEQIRKLEGYVGEIFTAFGLDMDTPGTKDTPDGLSRHCMIPQTDTRVILNYSRCLKLNVKVGPTAV